MKYRIVKKVEVEPELESALILLTLCQSVGVNPRAESGYFMRKSIGISCLTGIRGSRENIPSACEQNQ